MSTEIEKTKAAREALLLKRMEELEIATSSDPSLEAIRLATYESLLEDYTRLLDDPSYVPSELVTFGDGEANFDAQLRSSALAVQGAVPELPSYQQALEGEDDNLANILKLERQRAEERARLEEADRRYAEELSKQFEKEAVVIPRANVDIEEDRRLAEKLSGNFEDDRKFAELLQKEEAQFASNEPDNIRLARLLQQEGDLLRQAISFRKAHGLPSDPDEDRQYADFVARREKAEVQFREEAEKEAKRQRDIVAAKTKIAELTQKERSIRFQAKQQATAAPASLDNPEIIACETLDDIVPPEADVSNLSQGFIRVPQRYHDLILGHSHSTLKQIEKKTNTIIRAPQKQAASQTYSTFFVFGSPQQITAAKNLIAQLMKNDSPNIETSQLTAPLPITVTSTNTQSKPTQDSPVSQHALHVFVDYSNVLIGCRCFGSEQNVPNNSLQLDLGRLVEIIEHGRVTKTRGIAGSGVTVSDLSAAVAVGYSAWVADRPYGAKEKFVDEKLHAQILLVVANTKEFPAPQTLAIATGDGNNNGDDNSSSFPKCVELALDNGWNVELWSWKHCLSRRYREFQARFPDTFQIFFLDDFAVELIVPDFD